MWSRQDLGCSRIWSSHTLNVQTTSPRAKALANPGETRAVPVGRASSPSWNRPSVRAPPLSCGLCVDCGLWCPHCKHPAQPKPQSQRKVRAVGPTGPWRVCIGRSSLCYLHLSGCVCLPDLSPLACVCPFSACLLHSLYFSPPLANLPHLLCSGEIILGQDCYLISSLLAACSLYPLPFFLPADDRLPWQP